IVDYSNQITSDVLLPIAQPSRAQFNVISTLGRTVRHDRFETNSDATPGLSLAGIYNVSNAAVTPTLGQFYSRRQVNSIYGAAAFTFNNWWTVEGTARNDWSSTLPEGKNSYFYPSINTSIVLSDAIPALK